MKKAILVILIALSASISFGQKPKHDDYKEKKDSLQMEMIALFEWSNATIPNMYFEMREIQSQIDSLTALKDQINTKRDSLMMISDMRREQINNERKEILRRYIPYSEDALTDFYSSKSLYSKDSLETILKSLTPKVRKSKAAKRLKQYIYEEFPSLVGTEFKPFTCYSTDGKKYDWKQTQGKKMMIILDGFYCMNHMDPTAAGQYFTELCKKAGETFILVPFVYAEDIQSLKNTSEYYQIGNLGPVSDLEGDLSELELKYQVKGTPTTIYVDANGMIVHYELGLDTDRLEAFIAE